MLTFSLNLETFEQLQAAVAAVNALKSSPPTPLVVDSEENLLRDRIYSALNTRPLSAIEQAVAEVLFDHPADEWISYQDMLVELEKRGLASNTPQGNAASPVDYKAARALGLLSGRMKDGLSPADYANKVKPIEVLAARAKLFPDGVSYKLTAAGRLALAKLLT